MRTRERGPSAISQSHSSLSCRAAYNYDTVTVSAVWPFVEAVGHHCSGSTGVVAFAQAVNISFLYLFGAMYVETYQKPAAAGSKMHTKQQ